MAALRNHLPTINPHMTRLLETDISMAQTLQAGIPAVVLTLEKTALLQLRSKRVLLCLVMNTAPALVKESVAQRRGPLMAPVTSGGIVHVMVMALY
jgi:hypothetical protein